MKRVALVCECPIGGVAEHVRQLAAGLPRHGYEPVAVVASTFAYLDELRQTCEVITVPFRRDYTHPYDELRVLSKLVPMVDRFDLVHAHSSKAGALARVAAVLRGRPAIYSPHCFGFVGEVSTARRYFSTLVERALAPATAALICVCQSEHDLLEDHRIRPQRSQVIHNGSPHCSSEDKADMPDGLIVGTVCILRRQKALECLLDAMRIVQADIPEAKLVVAGEGPYEMAMRAYAARIGLDVAWLPYEAPASRYLHGFDVYALSSAWEAFPISVLEAQACGVPQVVTAVGGVPEAVVPQTGMVVAPRDPAALAEAIIELLRDPVRRAAMSKASRARHAEMFTVDQMVAATASVYDRVLGGS